MKREEDEELELDLFVLVSAFQRLLQETGDEEAVHMPKERLPITHFVGHIFDELTKVGGKTSFRTLIAGGQDRTYVIGAFLALLELIKLRKVIVTQDGVGDIQIEIRKDAEHPHSDDESEAAHVIDDLEMLETERPGPRVVFMGSPEFAVPALQSLAGAGSRAAPRGHAASADAPGAGGVCKQVARRRARRRSCSFPCTARTTSTGAPHATRSKPWCPT